MRALIRRYPVTSYFAIAFLFTWSLLPLASKTMIASLLALMGPAVAAFIVTAASDVTTREAFRARLTAWRVPWRWYVAALGLPIVMSALRSFLEYAAGARGPIGMQPISALSIVVFVLVAGEEIGWRGFATPQLIERHGPWLASMIVGVAWALWHLPLFFMPGMPQYQHPFAPYIAYTVALSLLLSWTGLRTRWSMLIATLFHGSVNTFGLVNEGASVTLRGWSNAACYLVAAAVIGAIAWRRTGYPRAVAVTDSRLSA